MRGDYFAAGVIISIGAVLLVLAMGWLDSGGMEYDEDSTWEFQDYRPAVDVLGVSGPVEMTTVGGEPYIHAIGTGKAEIVHNDGSVDRIRIVPARTDLVLIDGQSNSAYHRADPSKANTPGIGTAFYLGRPSGPPYAEGDTYEDLQIYDMIDGAGALRIGDKGPQFAKTWNGLTGHKVVWVSLGIPAMRIDHWIPDAGVLWRQNVAQMERLWAVLPDGFEIDRTIVLWAQGESDINTDMDTYVKKFTHFYHYAPEAWGVPDSEWFFIDGMPDKVGDVNAAFRVMSETLGIPVCVPYTMIERYTVANGLRANDLLHYTQNGDNAIADAAARFILKANAAPFYLVEATVETEAGTAPELPAVAMAYRTNQTSIYVPVSWNGVPDVSEPGTATVTGTTTAEMLPNSGNVILTAVVT